MIFTNTPFSDHKRNREKRKGPRWPAPFAIMFSVLLMACTNKNLSPPDTLTGAVSNQIQNINPAFTSDSNSQHVTELTHISLVQIGDNLLPEPWLAESIKWTTETQVRVQLKKGCKFETGEEITAEDVIQSWHYYIDPEVGSTFSQNFSRIESISILDAYNFIIHTRKPEPALLTDLFMLKIIPTKSLVGAKKKISLPGGGAYHIVSLEPDHILLERNPASCFPVPHTKYLRFKTVRDDLSRLLKLKTGEIDFVYNEMNYRKVESIQNGSEPYLKTTALPGSSLVYLGINHHHQALKDVRVREALALSLDIPEIIRYKNKNLSTQARNLIPDESFFANIDIPLRHRNLTRAKELLDQAGFYNGSNNKPPLQLSLKSSNNSIVIENIQIFAAQAKEAGIQIHLHPLEWGVFFSDVKSGNVDLYLLRFTGITDPSIYYDLFHSDPPGKTNRGFYKNPEMDKWLDLSMSTTDQRKRKKALAKVQEIAFQDIPILNLWHGINDIVFRKNITNLKLHPLGFWTTLVTAEKRPE